MSRLVELVAVEHPSKEQPVLIFRDPDGELWSWAPTAPAELADVLRECAQSDSDHPGRRLILGAIAECQTGRPYSKMALTRAVLETIAGTTEGRYLVTCPSAATRKIGPMGR